MRISALVMVLVVAGCGGDDETGDDAADDAGDDGAVGPCPAPGGEAGDAAPRFESSPATVRVGASKYVESDDVSLLARADLRAEPLPVLHTVGPVEGACRRLTSEIFHCWDPYCADGSICTAEETCTPIILGQSAGALTVSLGGAETVVEPDGVLRYQSDELEPDACAPVGVEAAGADFPAFSLESALVPPVEITNLPELGYFRGEGILVAWEPADPGARVRITFRADSASHGAIYPSIIECDAPDDAGSIEVPVAMMDAHIDEFGCGLCPETSVTRYRRVVAAAGETEVELVTEDELRVFLYPGGNGSAVAPGPGSGVPNHHGGIEEGAGARDRVGDGGRRGGRVR